MWWGTSWLRPPKLRVLSLWAAPIESTRKEPSFSASKSRPNICTSSPQILNSTCWFACVLYTTVDSSYMLFTLFSSALFFRQPLKTQLVVCLSKVFKDFMEISVLEHHVKRLYGFWLLLLRRRVGSSKLPPTAWYWFDYVLVCLNIHT